MAGLFQDINNIGSLTVHKKKINNTTITTVYSNLKVGRIADTEQELFIECFIYIFIIKKKMFFFIF